MPRAASQSQWLRLAEDVIDAALLRTDARRNVLIIARVIGWSADWRTGLSRPTVARLMEASGLSRRCVQNWLRWLEERHLLHVVEPGVTPRFRPGILYRPGSSNLAREWRLTVPVRESCTPSGFCSYQDSPTRARARETGSMDRRFAPDSPSAPSPTPPSPPPWPSGRNPQRRSRQLAAAESLRRGHMVLRRISARHLRSVLRPWFRAGWTPADVLHALEVTAENEPHLHADLVRHPAGWLAARLSWWLDARGAPLPSRSQQLAASRVCTLEEQATRKVEQERHAQAAAAVDVVAQAARIREVLAGRNAVQ